MKSQTTHITVILDRSRSIPSIRDDTIGGYNAYLQQQQNEPGEATLTLIQFDTAAPYEVIHHFLPIGTIPQLTSATFELRGGTPLYDAISRGIVDLAQSLAAMPEPVRPSQVIMAVVTDGQENSSREFNRAQVAQMIQEKQKQDWQFVFLSANLNALDDAEAQGILATHAMAYDKTTGGTHAAWSSFGRQTSAYRTGSKADMSFDENDSEQHLSKQSRSSRLNRAPTRRPTGMTNRKSLLLDALIRQGGTELNWGLILDAQPAP